MDRTERFYRIQRLLRLRRAVPLDEFLAVLEVSRATLVRDLEYLRNRLNVPIVWDRTDRGYRLDATAADQELPGLWFNAGEAYALLTMQHLLEGMEPGWLEAQLAPVRERLELMLGMRGHAMDLVRRRIRILHMARRPIRSEHFATLATGLLESRRLRIRHYNRASDTHTRREVSPQRLVHYRDNWYLDAWCHLRKALRSFAVDAIDAATLTDKASIDIAEADLDAVLAGGYGIFSGARVQWATLCFRAERARWVAAEQWHPAQRCRFLPDGRYQLELPYSDERELLMDILRHGREVEVLAPVSLRLLVQRHLLDAAAQYHAEDQH